MKKYWFYIESYIFISIKKNKALFYNTLDGNILEFSKNEIIELCKRLMIKQNHQIVKLSEEELDQVAIKNFVKSIRQKYMGDLLDISLSKGKPIQLLPYMKIHNNINKIRNSNETTGSFILRNLYDLTLYLDNNCNHDCSICSEGYKQFTCCTKKNISIQNIDCLKEILNNLKLQPLRINIVGNQKSLEDFLRTYKPIDFPYFTYVWYVNILNLSVKNNTELNICNIDANVIVSTINSNVVKLKLQRVLQINSRVKPVFIIQDEETYSYACKLVKDLSINNFEFKPFYSGRNMEFFRKHVFTNKKDIINNKASFKEIFTNQEININFFGRLIIANNENIYTSFYKKRIGTLKDDIKKVIHNELLSNTSWRVLRKNVMPCKTCVYQDLCSPISNIERSIGMNNLCNIRN